VQWQVSDVNNYGSFINLPNGTTTNLTLNTLTYDDYQPRVYQIVATDGVNPPVTNGVTITINQPSPPLLIQDVASTYVEMTAGRPVSFTAIFTGNNPLSLQWQYSANGTSYSPILNATNATYTIASPVAGNAGYYRLYAVNSLGSVYSSVVQTVLPVPIYPASGSYGAYVLSLNPFAFWPLNETASPGTGNLPAFDLSGNGFNGTYLADAQNGYDSVVAPQPPNYPKFATGQGALQTSSGDVSSVVKVPGLGFNTNTVTIAMWINPNGTPANSTGLFVNRNGGDAAGLGFAAGGGGDLGYWWDDNSGNTYNYESELYPVTGIWQLVVMVISPTQTTFYLDYVDGSGVTHLLTANNPVANQVEYFGSGSIFIGSDVSTANNALANNPFSGEISSVAVWNSAFTSSQVLALFDAGVGVVGNPPSITGEPANSYTLAGNTAQFSATGITGTTPLTYQWQHAGTNLVNSAIFSGVGSNTLTIANVSASVAGVYDLVVNNLYGTTTSSNAVLVIPTPSVVGEWLNGTALGTNFVDVSGYSPAGTHDAYLVGGTATGYYFTNDLPPAPGISPTNLAIVFYDGATGLSISNSSTLDATYTNTFDDQIHNQFSVSVWGKNLPGTWNPFVSKWGEGPPYNPPEGGWQLREDGASGGTSSLFTVRDNNVGTLVSGDTSDALDDMGAASFPSNDGKWHNYVGTFNGNTGERDLYVDGQLAAQETGNVPYALAPFSHVVIGGKDSQPGNTFGNFSTNIEIFDVKIFNYALSSAQVGTIVGVHAPSIAGQPQSSSDFIGFPAQVSVTGVTGTSPLVYQWYFNGTPIAANNANFTGANSNVLTIPNLQQAEAGTYYATVTNLYGSATSSNAVITAVAQSLVGEWLTNSTLTDRSGYSPAGTHDGYDAANTGGYYFTNDIPPFQKGQAIALNGTTAIAIGNSSTNDANYTNTFDNQIANNLTVSFWAKGFPAGWAYFVSKNGDTSGNENGWCVRRDGWNSGNQPCWTMRSPGGAVAVGAAPTYGDTDDLGTSGLSVSATTWNLYTATYNKSAAIRNLYLNGTLIASDTNCGAYNLAPSSHFVIGGFEAAPGGTIGSFLQAEFFDVRIYNYALSAAQVAGLTNAPPGTPIQFTGPVTPAAVSSNYVGYTVVFNAPNGGAVPLTNQWQFNGVNLVDGTANGVTISGSQTSTLTVRNVSASQIGTYTFNGGNPWGNITTNLVLAQVLPVATQPAGTLVGRWLTGTNNFADASGYSPVGTHDGIIKGGVSYYFTNDIPPNAPPGSQALYLAGVGLVISNTASVDINYTNTYDDLLTNSFTLSFWAKGVPSGWNYFVSKNGDTTGAEVGWTLRRQGFYGGNNPSWTMRSPTGTLVSGGDSYGSTDDMGSTNLNVGDGNWHFYVGAYTQGGNRSLYVDNTLVARESGEGAFGLAALQHFVIGGIDNNTNTTIGSAAYGSFFTGLFYDVRLYKTELTLPQLASAGTTTQVPPPPVSGPPTLTSSYSNGQYVLTWSTGTLQTTTNLLSGWTPVTTSSPYTVPVSTTNKQVFFRVSNP